MNQPTATITAIYLCPRCDNNILQPYWKGDRLRCCACDFKGRLEDFRRQELRPPQPAPGDQA